jgi:cell wall-associated NlpC family hydrolase
VIPLGKRGRFREVELPDGRRGWIEARSIGPARGQGKAVTRGSFVERLRSLMGTPYLWGGRTPMGLDCSAFTQLVLAEQGIALPRDAREQFERSRPLGKAASPTLGDLVFFAAPRRAPGHVGLALGGGFYVHARGAVRVSSLDPSNALYDNELAVQFCGYRRPSRRA